MYMFAWAFKNLMRNPLRSLRSVGFIAIILSLSMAGMAFLRGTNAQMKAGLMSSFGDVTVSERKALAGTGGAGDYLKARYGALVDESFEAVLSDAEALGGGIWTSVRVVGVQKGYFSRFRDAQAWRGDAPAALGVQQACLSSGLASKLGISPGDLITLRTGQATVMVNTVSVETVGSFFGSELIYEDCVVIPIEDARELFMLEPGIASALYVFLKPGTARADAQELYSDVAVRFFKDTITESTLLYPEEMEIYSIFQNYRALLLTAFCLFYVLACVILSFSSKNTFYLYYHSRRNELVTLLTYGMSKARIVAVAVIESLLLFSVALAVSAAASVAVGAACRGVSFASPRWSDLITIFGGPGLVLDWGGFPMAATVSLLFAIVLWSAASGVRMFLRQEVRQISAGI